MNFRCNVKVIDAVMGAGKSTAVIKMINESEEDKRFIIVVPYLTEVERYIGACKAKNFKKPVFVGDSPKFECLKRLIQDKENIVTTHAMFQKFNEEIIKLTSDSNYTLVLDEVANVVGTYDITKSDFDILFEHCVDLNEETNQLTWRKEAKDYDGRFSDEKRLCESGSLIYYGGKDEVALWAFPINVFNAFTNIYILTYMFEAQMQRCYYDFFGVPYERLTIGKDGNIVPYDPNIDHRKYNYRDLIHIVDNPKMNKVGDGQFALSSSWYKIALSGKSKVGEKQLERIKKNMVNFFNNKACCHSPSQYNFWTTFKKAEETLKGIGYTKKTAYTEKEIKDKIVKVDKYGDEIEFSAKCGFVPLNMRGSNDYRHADCVAYTVNVFLNPIVKRFFTAYDIKVNEDDYALSEMLQFIWRSAIRDGRPINVYVPSKRMRELLIKWINENSIVE